MDIYSHSSTSAINDINNENAGKFIVKNCVCDWLDVYGNGEAVRKKCLFENNKCHYIKIIFIHRVASLVALDDSPLLEQM